MTEKRIELSRRKILAGVGTIGVASAGAGLGTSAFLSDTESFTGNSIEAGELDLYVHYEFTADQGSVSGNLGEPTSGTVQGDEDGGATVGYSLADVKPGDSGSLEFCFSIVDNPAYLWMSGALTGDADNDTPEPETSSPWDRDGSSAGELATYTRASLYYTGDTSDSNDADVLITEGTLAGILADLEHGMVLHGDGDPTAGVVDRPTFDGGSSTEEPTDPTCVRLDWEVPTWVGNEIQADSVSFDLQFYAEQARHNDGTGDWTLVSSGDDLQTAVDNAADGDTLLLGAGNHTGSILVDHPVHIRGEGPSNTTYDAGGASTGMDVQTAGIRIGNLTATNAGQAIDVNGQATGSGRTSDIMLSTIVAENNTDRAIVVDYTDNALVRDIETVDNGNDGLTFWYTNDSHAETVTANNNGDNGIYFNGDNNILLDSEANNNVDEGVDLNWYDDLGPTQQRVTLDNVSAENNGEDDVELHDNGSDEAVADDSMLLRKVTTGGAPTGLRLVQVAASEVRTEQSSFPNGQLDGSDNDVDP